MAIVTLTTDYGLRDHYLAALKGAILSRKPELSLVDISHEIEPYNILQAAYLFRQVWRNFPPGTTHLISVRDFEGAPPALLCVEKEAHFFVGPNNGILSLIFDELPENCHAIPLDLDLRSPLRETYARAVTHLTAQLPPAELGPQAADILQKLSFHPVIGPAMIQGNVIYVDNYENVITNIQQSLFEQVGAGRGFACYFKRSDPIRRLVRHYFEAPVGSPLCRFNAAGFLEIAINMDKAASLLGLRVEDTVQVQFQAPKEKSRS